MKSVLKNILCGGLIVYALLIPLGFFEAWFWDSWSWGDPQHAAQPHGLQFWIQVICDALRGSFCAFFRFWLITIPFVLIYAYWISKRKQKRQDT
ncbi:MAG: hypothetical protein QOD03_280 [Verrucomicrobiota bacterium]|jgi:hypothetical protein